MDNNNSLSGIPSGFPSLDALTGGWQNSNLIIIASRPSVGKTAFAQNVVRNAAVDYNIPVAFFSLEMSSLQFATRIIRSEAKFNKLFFEGGRTLTEQEYAQLESRLAGLSGAPLYIDDTPGLKLSDFHEKAKKYVNEYDVRLIVIDYLQLMCGPDELRGQREEEVSFIARGLKTIAKELKVPIIATCQLSRSLTRFCSARPELSQLRESGAIEEVADSVILIHRPDIISIIENPADKELCLIIVAKNRNGGLGDVSTLFHSENLSFTETDEAIVIKEPKHESREIIINSRLNKKYTLNNFKIYPSNVEAMKVAIDIIGNLSNSRQVLLIGPSSSGKTHLVNAIGNAIESDKTVLYVTGDEFKNQYLDAIKAKRQSDFEIFYTKMDVLIVDNLQDMTDSGAQSAFSNIIHELFKSGKRLVCTSPCSIDELEGLFDKKTFVFLRGGRIVKIGKNKE